MLSTDAVATRTVGQFAVSIATSLALEGAIGIYPERPGENLLKKFPYIWINVRTIVRNIFGAYTGNYKDISNQQLADAVAQELSLIAQVVSENTNGFTKAVFYAYALTVPRGYAKFATFKDTTAEKERHFGDATEWILKQIRQIAQTEGVLFEQYNGVMNRPSPLGLILTHLSLDLLLFQGITLSGRVLLESHTGKLKTRPEWHTKLYNGKNLPNIPFDRGTIQLFGDSAGTIKPAAVGLRRMFHNLAIEQNWTYLTNKSIILGELKKNPEYQGLYELMAMYYR